MFVYVLFGKFFAKRKLGGQIMFLGLGLVLIFFSQVIMGGLLGLKLSVVPSLSFLGVSLTAGGLDITYLLPIAFVVALYYARADIKAWLGM